MSPHLGLQRIMIPSAQVSSLTTGSVTLPSARGAFVTPSPYNGYIFGGYNGSSNITTILKMNYVYETVSTLSATLTSTRGGSSTAFNNNGVAGYAFAGGGTTNESMDKFTYSTETISASTAGPSGQGRNYAGGIDNTLVASYAGGGEASSPLTYYSNYLKFTFSNATWTTGGNQSLETNNHTGSENGSTAGYHWGNIGSSYVTARKVTFSNDTWANSFTSPSRVEYGSHAPSNGTIANYQFGGISGGTGAILSQITKLTLSGETASTLGATLSAARRLIATMSDWSSVAYACGGTTDTTAVNTINKFTYSGETISTLSATLPFTVYTQASVSNHA